MDWEKLFFMDNEQPLDRFPEGISNTAIFRTMAFIGDSLSSGEFESRGEDHSKGYHDYFEYSWGQYIARKNGLSLPIVWNTGGWELPESVASVKDYSDIWLSDFKYFDNSLAEKFSDAKNYFENAFASLKKMVEQTGEAVFGDNGMMKKGVIVRHLVLPGHTDDSKKILRLLWENFGDKIWISIMNQYTPLCKDERYPELFRSVTDEEYDEVIDYALSLGIENAFVQEGGAVGESFIPPFDLEGV